MDSIRYGVALMIVCFLPGALLYWFSIHPGISFWRKVGVRATVTIHWSAMMALAVGAFLARDRILTVDYGTHYALAGVAVVLLVCAGALRRRLHRKFFNRILMGMAEIAGMSGPGVLVTEGMHARIRHPRYAQLVLAISALVLLANFLATYIVFVAGLGALMLIVPLEERELPARFGSEYEAYAARVPRLIPKLF